jgi:hypothetical protein
MEANPWKIGLVAARANLVPGLVLQAAACALLAGYLWAPAVRAALEIVAGWQERYGVAFSFASYFFFCGVAPYLFCLALPSLRPRQPGRAALFVVGFWAPVGLILPLFYAFQGYLYGDGTDLWTLVCKVVTDQCGYTAFFASPVAAVAHLWKARDYRWHEVAPLLGRGWYRRLVVPNLIANWALWCPSMFIIYSLPPALQSHVAGLIGCFWALMCLEIGVHTRPAAPGREPAGGGRR